MALHFSEYGVGPVHLSVTQIVSLSQGNSPMPCQLSTATGFFYENGDDKYLITNRHVVIDELNGYFPNVLRIIVHNDINNIREIKNIFIKLYEAEMPLWLEHQNNREVDVVALRINEYLDGDEIVYYINDKLFPHTKDHPDLTQNVIIVGYPLGFFDEINFIPIVRSGMFSSPYSIPFEGQPCFLLEANIHTGASGSPVLFPTTQHRVYKEGLGQPHLGYNRFLGILSAKFTPHGIDLGVGKVWYYYVVDEIVNSEKKGEIRV